MADNKTERKGRPTAPKENKKRPCKQERTLELLTGKRGWQEMRGRLAVVYKIAEHENAIQQKRTGF